VSGGATAALLPVFFLLPNCVAFQDRLTLTAIGNRHGAGLSRGVIPNATACRRC